MVTEDAGHCVSVLSPCVKPLVQASMNKVYVLSRGNHHVQVLNSDLYHFW